MHMRAHGLIQAGLGLLEVRGGGGRVASTELLGSLVTDGQAGSCG